MSRWGFLAKSRTSDRVSLPNGPNVNADVHYVAPRFFETINVALLLGRDLAWADRESASRVVVVNLALARRLFPDGRALSGKMHMNDIPIKIVNIANDTKFDSLRQKMRPTAYIPFRQNPQYSMTYTLRSKISPGTLTSAVRQTIATVDPNVPLYEIRTQTERLGETMRHERLFAFLLAAFALLTLLLASVSIYDTLAYQVGRRTPEIGLRLALGAGGSDIVRLILRDVLAPVVLGIGLGVATALAGGRVVEAMLFGVTPRDPQAFLTAAAVLVASAALAGWWPARRASRIAPMEALRNE
jgi:ABC-type antimicrobial peptide transport system permease subunit